jgi:hypothetical protein
VPVVATVNVAVLPSVTVWLAGCVVIVGGVEVPTPVPVSETEFGDEAAVLEMISAPGTVPTAVGLKLTFNETLCVGVNVSGSEGSVPRAYTAELMLMLLIVKFAVPVFCTFTVCALLELPTV